MKRETIQLQALFYETATAIEFSENAIITMRRTKSMQHHPPEYQEMNCRSNQTQQTAKWEFKASRVQFPFFSKYTTVKWQTCLSIPQISHSTTQMKKLNWRNWKESEIYSIELSVLRMDEFNFVDVRK